MAAKEFSGREGVALDFGERFVVCWIVVCWIDVELIFQCFFQSSLAKLIPISKNYNSAAAARLRFWPRRLALLVSGRAPTSDRPLALTRSTASSGREKKIKNFYNNNFFKKKNIASITRLIFFLKTWSSACPW
jgi:hypothetical protein